LSFLAFLYFLNSNQN